MCMRSGMEKVLAVLFHLVDDSEEELLGILACHLLGREKSWNTRQNKEEDDMECWSLFCEGNHSDPVTQEDGGSRESTSSRSQNY